jgi:hypothetical protein
MHLRSAACVVALTLLPTSASPAQGVLNVPDAGVTLKLPPLQKVSLVPSDDPLRLRWLRGWLGEKPVELSVYLLPRDRFALAEPNDVVDESERRYALTAADKAFEFAEREEISGSFGALSYACYATGELVRASGSKARTTIVMVATVSERGATSVELVLEGSASEGDLATIRASLAQGLTVAGKPRDPQWSEGEALFRWERDVPEKVRKDPLKPAARTAHYIVLTNSSNGAPFARRMEEHFTKVEAALPLKERDGRRLMPVLLFKSREDYGRFCEAMKIDAAVAAKGRATKDWYATWFESLNDPVHLREATRQIVRNRFGLAGGGAWFDEGLAEFVATKRDERNFIAATVAKGKAVPLHALIEMPTLAAGVDARRHALEAALLIEFVHESPATKEKFADFLAKVGTAPRRSVPGIERALRASLGMTIEELERAFTEYCSQR